MRRRVYDTFADRYGTAVAHLIRDNYLVEWDEPTPHQDEARVPIPSKFFQWADDVHTDGRFVGHSEAETTNNE